MADRQLSPDADLLRRLKAAAGWSERDIANLLDCKRELVSAYLTGRCRLFLEPVERELLAETVARIVRDLKLLEMEL
jgi:transcriptional regulator with XRE-family HTH domain